MRDLRYDPAHIAGFFDRYGEQEWERLERDPVGRVNFAVHRRLLEEFVRPGDRVLEAGAGPGRFTLELARLGARIVVGDISAGQLAAHAERTAEVEDAIEERRQLDILDLSAFGAESFDATVCYGGPLSYVVERIDEGLSELLRVTRRGGYVLFSVMSLIGSTRAFFSYFPDLIERFGWKRAVTDVIAAGDLDAELNNGHVLRMYRWRTLEELLRRHPCRIAAASAANFVVIGNEELFEQDERWLEEEIRLCREPGALDGGTHIVVALERLESQS